MSLLSEFHAATLINVSHSVGSILLSGQGEGHRGYGVYIHNQKHTSGFEKGSFNTYAKTAQMNSCDFLKFDQSIDDSEQTSIKRSGTITALNT